MSSRGDYAPLAKGDLALTSHEDERTNSTDSTQFEYPGSRTRPSWIPSPWLLQSMRWLAIVDAALIIATFFIYTYSIFGVMGLTDHELIVATNSYSPLLSRTKIEMRDEMIKTALINRHNEGGPSLLREPPSPEVDEAWRRLHKGDRLYVISEEEVRKMGKDPSVVIKAPLEWGYGDGQYLAVNQGQHDIHCLNNIRMWIYAEHYYGNRTKYYEIHAQHCLHTLLQTFQCKYSTDVYTAFWVEGSLPPVVDFNLKRKCQNYDNILHWNPEKPYTEDQFAALRPPAGQKRIPANVY